MSEPASATPPLADPGNSAQELALLRAQLQALVGLTQAPAAARPPEEVTLLRDQLTSLSALITAPPQTSPAPPRTSEETALLGDILTALLPEFARIQTTAVPSPPIASPAASPTMARIEAALAALLQDLVQETDRRVRAENEAARAQALLRDHGFHDRPAPHRPPAPPRNGA